ncbi:ABC transporter permease subunit [Mycoplasmopsis primatum]|uniref:ABC transporter permease subunit n=1 Tax=Mycoplasmopsis primatum TaxID=55604 RepID=UPI00049637FC|nr:ABC transporter permease subunit [Mycoplasmopsis primatum]
MNFYKYFFKKLGLTLLGIFLVISFFYIIIAPFINNPSFNKHSVIANYFKFLGSIFTNFGQVYSASSFSNALNYFFYYFKYSLLFEGITFLLTILLGYALGIFLAYKNGKWSEITINLFIFIFASVPVIIIAPLMLILAEFTDLPVNFITADVINSSYMMLSLLLPISILLLATISFFAILVKNAMLKILSQEFILALKTCGQSKWNIFIKGIFKNLIIDTINKLISVLIIIISFSIILERIFQIPGQSLILISALSNGEINVIMCLIFYKAFIIFTLSFGAEISYDVMNVNNHLSFDYKISFVRRHKLFKAEKEVK